MKKGILIVLMLFIPGLLFLNYIGVFTGIDIEEREIGPFQLIYLEQTGPYKLTGATIEKVYNSTGARNITGSLGFGIYLDDPKKTPESRLRSIAGVALTAYSDTLADSLMKKEFPLQRCVVAEYPNNNFLSVYAGIAKVYPKLYKYLEKKKYRKGPVMELYDKDKILYVIPVKQQ